MLSLLSTLLLLASVLQHRQQSQQTLEQQVSFDVPDNSTQANGPSTGEEHWNSWNSTTTQWSSSEEDSAAHDVAEFKKAMASIQARGQPAAAFNTRSTHIEYPQEVAQITYPQVAEGMAPPPPPPPPPLEPLLPSPPSPALPSRQNSEGETSSGQQQSTNTKLLPAPGLVVDIT